eukprot:g15649.t1
MQLSPVPETQDEETKAAPGHTSPLSFISMEEKIEEGMQNLLESEMFKQAVGLELMSPGRTKCPVVEVDLLQLDKHQQLPQVEELLEVERELQSKLCQHQLMIVLWTKCPVVEVELHLQLDKHQLPQVEELLEVERELCQQQHQLMVVLCRP